MVAELNWTVGDDPAAPLTNVRSNAFRVGAPGSTRPAQQMMCRIAQTSRWPVGRPTPQRAASPAWVSQWNSPRLHCGKVDEVSPEEASAAGLCRDNL